MKLIEGITKDEVYLSSILLNIFDLELEDNYLCKDDIIILVDGKRIKMIQEGVNEIDNQTVLFRPLKSKSLSLFLIQELLDLDQDLDIYVKEHDKKEKSMIIKDSDRNILSSNNHKDLKKCILITLVKFFFGKTIESEKLLNIINDYK